MKRKAAKKYFWEDLEIPDLRPALQAHAKKVARAHSLAQKLTQTTDPEEHLTLCQQFKKHRCSLDYDLQEKVEYAASLKSIKSKIGRGKNRVGIIRDPLLAGDLVSVVRYLYFNDPHMEFDDIVDLTVILDVLECYTEEVLKTLYDIWETEFKKFPRKVLIQIAKHLHGSFQEECCSHFVYRFFTKVQPQDFGQFGSCGSIKSFNFGFENPNEDLDTPGPYMRRFFKFVFSLEPDVREYWETKHSGIMQIFRSCPMDPKFLSHVSGYLLEDSEEWPGIWHGGDRGYGGNKPYAVHQFLITQWYRSDYVLEDRQQMIAEYFPTMLLIEPTKKCKYHLADIKWMRSEINVEEFYEALQVTRSRVKQALDDLNFECGIEEIIAYLYGMSFKQNGFTRKLTNWKWPYASYYSDHILIRKNMV